MSENTNNSLKKKRRKSNFLRSFIKLLILIVLLWPLFVLGGRALCKIAIDQIAELTNTKITTDSVKFDLNGSVLIKNLVIHPGSESSDEHAILKAKTVYASFGIPGLVLLRPRITKISVTDFVFNARHDLETDQWNVSALKIMPPKAGSGKIPLVSLKRGNLKYTRVSKVQSKVVVAVPVDAEFSQSQKETDAYEFTVATGQLARFAKSTLQGTWKPGRFAISGGISSAQGPELEKKWSINVLAAQWDYDTENNYSLKLAVNNLISEQEFSVESSTLHQISFLKKLNFFAAIQRLLVKYRPAGQVNIILEACGNLKRLNESKIVGNLDCRDVSVCNTGFPYLIKNLAGSIDFTEKSVILNNLIGRHDDVSITIEGWVRNFGKNLQYQTKIKSSNMVLDNDLYIALNEKHKKLWQDFQPDGIVSFEYNRSKFSPVQNKRSLKVELLNVNAAYRHFYYPLRNMTGTLLFDGDDLTLSNVVSVTKGHKIILNGRIAGTRKEKPDYEIAIQATNVQLDSTFIEALPQKEKDFCARLSNAGTVTFENINCRVYSSEKSKEPDYQLSLTTNPLQINDKLLGFLPKTIQNLSSSLHPKGKVICSSVLNKTADSQMLNYRIIINCLGIEVNPDYFSYPLKDISGSITITKDSLTLRNICATSAKNVQITTEKPEIKIDGQVTFGGTFYKSEFQISAHDIFMDERLSIALPKHLGDYYNRFSPSGRLDFNNVKISLSREDVNDKLVEIDGDFGFRDCSFSTFTTATDAELKLKVKAHYKTGNRLSEFKADIENSSLKIGGKLLKPLNATLYYDKNKKTWYITDLLADSYEGKLTASLQVKEAADKSFEYLLQAALDDIDLKQFLEDSEHNSENERTTGKAGGSLTVRGQIGDKSIRFGRCRLEITDMKVGKLSPLAKLFHVLKLEKPTDFAFNRIIVDSYIKSDRLLIDKIDLSGRSVAFNGSGWMNLTNKNIDLTLTARSQRHAHDKPDILQSLTEDLGRGVVRMEVAGSLYDPKITTTTLPVIKETFNLLGSENTQTK